MYALPPPFLPAWLCLLACPRRRHNAWWLGGVAGQRLSIEIAQHTEEEEAPRARRAFVPRDFSDFDEEQQEDTTFSIRDSFSARPRGGRGRGGASFRADRQGLLLAATQLNDTHLPTRALSCSTAAPKPARKTQAELDAEMDAYLVRAVPCVSPQRSLTHWLLTQAERNKAN